MYKRWAAGLCAAVLLGASASAEPVLSYGGNTAYLNEDNLLTVMSSEERRTIDVTMSDLLGMDGETLLCLTADNQLWRVPMVNVDGHIADIVSVAPDQRVLEEAVQGMKPYQLQGTVLTMQSEQGLQVIEPHAQAACGNADMLCYAANGQVLRIWYNAGAQEAEVLVKQADVIGMTLTRQTLTMVTADHHALLLDLDTIQTTDYGVLDAKAVSAVYLGDRVIGYASREQGYQAVCVLTQNKQLIVRHTAVPTATPTPTANPNQVVAMEGYVSQGDRGEHVSAMQRRLKKLGYPVGSVDGKFGKNTLLALNLFQFAVGYTEHSYADERCINRLNRSNAPKYDPYLPLAYGQKGTPIRLMQERLKALGYYMEEKLSGKYDDVTVQAAQRFQLLAGQPGDGKEMTRELLELLFDEEHAPGNVTPAPEPTETPAPVEPTVEPTLPPEITTPTDLTE